VSVFNYDPANYGPEQDDQDSYDGSHNHSQSSASFARSPQQQQRQRQRKMDPASRKVTFTKPQDLPPNAAAAEVIRAWAAQLKGNILS
jgi:hypothetical protein